MNHLDASPTKCFFDVSSVPLQPYRLPGDGRKWKILCGDRRTLTLQLTKYARPDGTGITVGATRLCKELGWCRAKLFKRLAEIETLGFLETAGRIDGNLGHGTAKRRLNLQVIAAKSAVHDSQAPSTIDQPPSTIQKTGVQDSQAGVHDSQGRGLRLVVPESTIERPESKIRRPESTLSVDTNDNETTTTNVQPPLAVVGGGAFAQRPDCRSAQPTAEQTLDLLKTMLADAEDKIPQVGKAKRPLLDLIRREGHDSVVLAWKACIQSSPWKGDTTHHLRYLVNDFQSYLHLAKKKDASKLTPEQIERTYELARQAHAEQWKLTDKDYQRDETPAEAFLD